MAACLAMGTGFWAIGHGLAVADYYPYPSPDSDQTQINKAAAEFFSGRLSIHKGPSIFGRPTLIQMVSGMNLPPSTGALG